MGLFIEARALAGMHACWTYFNHYDVKCRSSFGKFQKLHINNEVKCGGKGTQMYIAKTFQDLH